MPLKNNLTYRLLFRARLLVALLTSLLATVWTRLIIISISVVILLYLIYARAWSSFTSELTLPIGVTPTNPELNTTLLNDINTQRTERIQGTRPDFRPYSELFVPPAQSR